MHQKKENQKFFFQKYFYHGLTSKSLSTNKTHYLFIYILRSRNRKKQQKKIQSNSKAFLRTAINRRRQLAYIKISCSILNMHFLESSKKQYSINTDLSFFRRKKKEENIKGKNKKKQANISISHVLMSKLV